jgi:polyisoprenoid-binding protein YceI
MKVFLICFLLLGHIPASKAPVTVPKPGGVSILTVDPANSNIAWHAEKLTGSHNGTVKVRSGSLTMHCGQLAKGSIIIGMNTLAVTHLGAPDKQKLENNLRGNNFFDTGKFPDAKLDIVSVEGVVNQLNHQVVISGNLTLHGITRKIDFTANVAKSTATDFAAQADIVINRRNWDIATSDFKYNTLIRTDIRLLVSLLAKQSNQQITSL